jgi:hypothetical protein
MICPSQASKLNHPDYIRWLVQTMKFLVVKPSPLPIYIPLGSKYSPQDPVFKYYWFCWATSLLNVPNDCFPFIAVCNIIIECLAGCAQFDLNFNGSWSGNNPCCIKVIYTVLNRIFIINITISLSIWYPRYLVFLTSQRLWLNITSYNCSGQCIVVSRSKQSML